MLHQHTERHEQADGAEMVDALARFDGAPEAFLALLVEAQCRMAGAEAGVIFRFGAGDGEGAFPEVIATHPAQQGAARARWLDVAAEGALRSAREARVFATPLASEDDLYGEAPRSHIVFVPLASAGAVAGAGAYLVSARDRAALGLIGERLSMTRGLIGAYEARVALREALADRDRLRTGAGVAVAAGEQARARAAFMALCNEGAAALRCERASLGFLKGRAVQLVAMSHTERIVRKMRLVQQLEEVMEECIDQDLEALWPAAPGGGGATVTRVAEEFAREHGPLALCSLPLRREGRPVGVLTLERPVDRPFERADVEAARLAADLATARLVELREHDRWVGARVAREARGWGAALLGPERVWIKLGALAGLAAVVFLVFVKGVYRVEAPFVLEALERQVAPAPFDGYIATVGVEPGDAVAAGETTLATLDTSELRLALAAARAEQARFAKEASIARRDKDIAAAQIAEAGGAEAQARIDLLEHQIGRATIVAGIDGVVVAGDLKRQLGAPVRKGAALFEIAPIDSLRADVAAPEDQIADVIVGQRGHLAPASHPSLRIPFEVERINPMAEVIDGRNVFRVRVRLLESRPWMRPGMEGVAKIDVERRPYGSIWSRRLVNWLRMTLWI